MKGIVPILGSLPATVVASSVGSVFILLTYFDFVANPAAGEDCAVFLSWVLSRDLSYIYSLEGGVLGRATLGSLVYALIAALGFIGIERWVFARSGSRLYSILRVERSVNGLDRAAEEVSGSKLDVEVLHAAWRKRFGILLLIRVLAGLTLLCGLISFARPDPISWLVGALLVISFSLMLLVYWWLLYFYVLPVVVLLEKVGGGDRPS